MKHIFIVNPAAGSHDATDDVRIAVEQCSLDIDYEIYRTKCQGDAAVYVKKVCSESDEKIRFYACGGDGTLNEVIGATVEFDNVSVAVYPMGSGNDFLKYYGTAEDFRDIKDLINGVDEKIDIFKVNDKYAINAVHFGFDTAVLRTMMKVRRKKIIGGKRAYYTGVVTALINGMKSACNIFADGKAVSGDKILLCTIANGKYVGGSYKCAPRSVNNDGLMEVCTVRPISRFTFLKLMGVYEKGTHLDDPRFEKYINYCRAQKIEVKAKDGFYVSLDGELNVMGDFTVEVLKQAVSFTIPAKLAPKFCNEKEIDAVVC